MKRMNYRSAGRKMKSSLQALPSMGIAFVVLGVVVLASSFAFSIKSNFLLLTGLFFIVAGTVGYVYSLKKG